MLQGAIIGALVAVGMLLWRRYQASQGTGLAGEIERALEGKPPLNLSEVAALVGQDTFLGRGQVAQSLAALQSLGKVKAHDAPPGTPQLEKVKHIRYERVA